MVGLQGIRSGTAFAVDPEVMSGGAMTTRTEPGTVRIEVRFPSAGKAGSCLESLSRIPGVLLNILRGRVTAREAVYEVELSGRGAGVRQAVWSLRAGASCP
jgi:hypothetical protein